jgi:hypothetical protein
MLTNAPLPVRPVCLFPCSENGSDWLDPSRVGITSQCVWFGLPSRGPAGANPPRGIYGLGGATPRHFCGQQEFEMGRWAAHSSSRFQVLPCSPSLSKEGGTGRLLAPFPLRIPPLFTLQPRVCRPCHNTHHLRRAHTSYRGYVESLFMVCSLSHVRNLRH